MPRVNVWQRLGEQIRTDRVRLGMRTQPELARRAGLGRRTVSDLERGARANYSPDTLGAVEAALGWAPGTVSRILAGGQVEREGDVDWERLGALWLSLDDRSRRVLMAVADALAAL